METLKEIKEYSNERCKIRINSFGYTNSRITKMTLKKLKGYLKQYENHPTLKNNGDMDKIEKEVEFRQLCLSLKNVFCINVK